MPVLKYRDPASGNWVELPGVPGPTGPAGSGNTTYVADLDQSNPSMIPDPNVDDVFIDPGTGEIWVYEGGTGGSTDPPSTTWLNHVVLGLPYNGTNQHAVNPASSSNVVSGASFTPTPGRLLVCLMAGAITSTIPSGWVQPVNGAAVGGTGLYLITRTATGDGGDAFTTTHNAVNFPFGADVYEFPQDTVLQASNAAPNVPQGQQGPLLSGLFGSNWVAAVACVGTEALSLTSFTWDIGNEAVDYGQTRAPTGTSNGYVYSLDFISEYTASTFGAKASYVDPSTHERLVFALSLPVASASPRWIYKGTLGSGSGAIAGSYPNQYHWVAEQPVGSATSGLISGENIPLTVGDTGSLIISQIDQAGLNLSYFSLQTGDQILIRDAETGAVYLLTIISRDVCDQPGDACFTYQVAELIDTSADATVIGHIVHAIPFSTGAGGTAVSADPGNQARLGSDDLIFVPALVPDPSLLGYRHVQIAASTSWLITHSLSFRPNVAVVDSAGSIIWPGSVRYLSPTQVQLTFSAAVGGEAYLS